PAAPSWWNTACAATPASITRIATSSSSASTCSCATIACAPSSAATAATTFAVNTGGMSCLESTSGCSRKSETPPDNYRLLVVERAGGRERADHRRRRATRIRRLTGRGGRLGPVRQAPATRTNLVALDHLVQRRWLDVQQLRRPFLDAAGRLERRLDEAFL